VDLPCLWVYLVRASIVSRRSSYLPEASNVALDVAGYSLIYMVLSVHQSFELTWSVSSTYRNVAVASISDFCTFVSQS
jgi:hypothetical protein